MKPVVRVSWRRQTKDEGAAAVEFALLLPIFVLLVFGALSLGLIYWNSITAAQAARDAARYGSTLPIVTTPVPNTSDVDAWLAAVSQVALRESGIGDANGDGTIDGTDVARVDAYICVAFVRGDATTLQATKSKVVSAASGPATTQPCVDTDGAPSTVDRVQVVIKRDQEFQAFVLSRSFTSETISVQPYSRVVK